MENQARTMGIEEFATLVGIGRRFAYEKAAANELPVPVIRIGRRLLIPRDAVERLLNGEAPAIGSTDAA